LNNIKNVHLINDNIKNYKLYFKENSIDIITCNPPYFKINSNSIVNKNKIKMIARHEVEITLEEIIDISSKLLKSKGKLFLVYNTSRFVELIKLLDKYKFGVKRIDCVYNDLESNCSMILVEAKKDGKDDVIITKPILSKNYRGDIL
jgi:tRNA1(Val) A37 N6-methylase TrmN6